ncbi:hypothetical protein ACQKWADRAFT_300225 [Trichoderma austrokoningii]
MSGLEIVALVPSIISAWCAVAVEYRSWRKRRAKRASERKNTMLQNHLQSIAPMLNSQFQEHFRRGGGAFQRGDEIGISGLKDQLIHAQRIEIDLLKGQRDNPSDAIHPNHDSIFGESSTGRDQTMAILSQQYQRLSQAQPIQQMSNNSGAMVLSSADSSGNSPILMDRKRLQVDAYGVADFQSCTNSGGPCQPGRYKIICNFGITEVHVRGILMDGSVTGATFNGVMPYPNSRIFSYVPGTANTPVLRGFKGCFTVSPEGKSCCRV